MSVDKGSVETVPLLVNPESYSNFTYKDLEALNDANLAYLSPLAVVGLIDLNAFFAQVERNRLEKSDDDPVVCVQWQSLIAVSYAARKYGIGRMDTLASALKKCPHLIAGHAAVFKSGESNWAYVEGLPLPENHKVSLDPYRRESRKILKICQRYCDLVEKASVDECYMDFGRMVYNELLEIFPFLRDKNSEYLPPIPELLPNSIKGIGEIIMSNAETNSVDHSSKEFIPQINDWDDVCILIGSKLIFELRKQIYNALGYKTSGGIARCKQVAKLAGGLHKPDNQTIVRNLAINYLLESFELTDITGMGGKMGDMIIQRIMVPPGVNSISFIRDNYDFEKLQEIIKDPALSKKVHEIVRGDYRQILTSRVDYKSMLSSKNFNFKLDTVHEAENWFKVFVGDIMNRLSEVDDENINQSIHLTSGNPVIKRPKTVTIHIKNAKFASISRQAPVTFTLDLDKLKNSIQITAVRLLKSHFNVSDSNDKIPPIANLGLLISNFAKLNESSMIDTYVDSEEKRDAGSTRKMFQGVEDSRKNQMDSSPKKEVDFGSRDISTTWLRQKDMKKSDSEYIEKLFDDFHKSESNKSTSSSAPGDTRSSLKRRALGKELSKESKDYINHLFDNFELTRKDPMKASNVAKPSSETQNKKTRKSKNSSTLYPYHVSKKQPLLDTLIEKKCCPYCDTPVVDVFEHNDFHAALELSEKLNNPEEKAYKAPFRGHLIKSRELSKKTVGASQKGGKDHGQSLLPF